MAVYALSLLMVFLCLAALYESWSVPLAVMTAAPLGILGALAAATLFGLNNDVYFQVGLLTTVGVSAKNAILIVEFADAERRSEEHTSELQSIMRSSYAVLCLKKKKKQKNKQFIHLINYSV